MKIGFLINYNFKLFLLIALSFILIKFSVANEAIKPENKVDIGEKMTFRIVFNSALTGNLKAGIAVAEISKAPAKFNKPDAYKASLTGKSSGFIELFYKVNDRFESIISAKTHLPYVFIRDIQENKYIRNEQITFDRKRNVAINGKTETSIPENVHDIVSMFFYFRSFEVSDLKNKTIKIPFFLDDTVSVSSVKFFGIENIKTKYGEFECLVIKPMVLTGGTFDEDYPITFYVTNDDLKVPVLIESKLSVGKMKVELIEYNRELKGSKEKK